MSDLYNPWGPELELAPEDAALLRDIVARWRLDDVEAAKLLLVRIETWRNLREGTAPCLLDAETRMRVSHCFDVSEAIAVLEPGMDEGDWIRRGHPMLMGRPTLWYLLEEPDALRSVRWTLLCETRTGFPWTATDAAAAGGSREASAPTLGGVLLDLLARIWTILRSPPRS